MAKTLEQRRADYAFDKVKKIKDREYASEFSSLVAKIPSYVMTNGLGNTLAFLFSKKKDHHLVVAGIMADWIMREISMVNANYLKNLGSDWIENPKKVSAEQEGIMKGLVLEPNISQYAVITDELLSLFVWLKRFCDGMIEKKESDNG